MRHNAAVLCGVILLLGSEICALGQQSKPTVRHHRVEEPAPEQTTPPEVIQAEDEMRRGNVAAAKALLERATAEHPNDYRAWFDLGYIAQGSTSADAAIAAFRKAYAAKPDVFETNFNLGMLLANNSRYMLEPDEAEKYLRAATKLKPTEHPQESLMNAWLGLGRLLETKEPTQALIAYDEASKVNPNNPLPHVFAGLFYETHDCRICVDTTTNDRLNEAVNEYKAALDINPNASDALNGLARVYERQKNYAAAEITLRKLVVLNDNVSLELASVLSQQGKYDEAAQVLEAEIRAHPSNSYAVLQLGRLYVNSGKEAEGEQQFRAAIQLGPQDADAHFALGSLLMHEKRYPEAQRELQTTIKLKPELVDAYGNLAVVAAANENYALTLEVLDQRSKMTGDTPATLFLRATTYDHLKAVPKAVEYYQRFLAVDEGKFPDQEWQARHRLIALDPQHADKYRVKTK